MSVVVYLTAVAEQRCYEELEVADMVEDLYGAPRAAARMRKRAWERLSPYKKIWWKSAKQEKPECC